MCKTATVTISLFLVIFIINCTRGKRPYEKSSALVSKNARKLTDIKFASSPERIERGKYLVNGVLRCYTCHSPLDTSQAGRPPVKGKEGSGGLFFEQDSFHLYAPNITPDKETGAGTWTDDMFARAIREGVGHDGRALTRMPYQTYSNLSDEDLASVIVYLRSIPPVRNKVPGRYLSADREQSLQNEERKIIGFVSPPDSSVISKGKYFITLGECEGCHTGWYVRNPGVFAGGNIIHSSAKDSVCSPNITPDGTGIGTWDDETFIRIIRTGKAGMLNWVMPWISYKNISDQDLSSIFAALKTLTPVQHRVINGMPPTYCEVCGTKHGFGDHNKIIPMMPFPVNTNLYASYVGKYVSKVFGDTTFVMLKDKKLWLSFQNIENAELIPVSATRFQASGFLAPISFEKDKTGKANTLLLYDIVTDTSLRVD